MEKSIKETKERHLDKLMSIGGVTAVGIGKENNKEVIIISIDSDSAELRSKLPVELDGFPVSIKVTGTIRAQ